MIFAPVTVMQNHLSKLITRPPIKKVTKVMRKVHTVDKVYNNIVNPISFFEIAWDDLPEVGPYEQYVQQFMLTIPGLDTMFGFYGDLTTDKDLIETCLAFCIKLRKVHHMSVRHKSLFVIKTYTLMYKLVWLILACCGIPKTHEHMVCILDYVNFVLSNITG